VSAWVIFVISCLASLYLVLSCLVLSWEEVDDDDYEEADADEEADVDEETYKVDLLSHSQTLQLLKAPMVFVLVSVFFVSVFFVFVSVFVFLFISVFVFCLCLYNLSQAYDEENNKPVKNKEKNGPIEDDDVVVLKSEDEANPNPTLP
jgi:hypothetical protein